MSRRIVSGIMLTLILISMFTLAFNIQPVKASGTIYIRADGSIDPSTANITSVDNITYTFTGNIYDEIVVERDNIVVDGAGYTVQGTGGGDWHYRGIDLSGRSNVTIKNTTIKAFEYGIYLRFSSNNSISENNITNKDCGIYVDYSSSNSISGNNITANNEFGIWLFSSSSNSISGNNITNNWYGIGLSSSSSNSISGNNITNNWYGIELYSSSNNSIFHNNFINNDQQVYIYSGYANVWDDGYPSGGNYWSGYMGVDVKSGPNQDQLGSDGIGDTPYTIDADNQDGYPLMKPYLWSPHNIGITSVTTSKTVVGQGYNVSISVTVENQGDYTETFNITVYANTTVIATLTDITLTSGNSTTLTFPWNTTGFDKGKYTTKAVADTVPGETDTADNTYDDGIVTIAMGGDLVLDGIIDIFDLVTVAMVFGSTPSDPVWDPNADIVEDNIINIFDIVAIAVHFGETGP